MRSGPPRGSHAGQLGGPTRARLWTTSQRCTGQGVAGKRAITGDTALRLGHWFCNSAQFWPNLQSAYELRLAEQAAGPEIEALPVMPDSKATPQQPRTGAITTSGTSSTLLAGECSRLPARVARRCAKAERSAEHFSPQQRGGRKWRRARGSPRPSL